MFLSTKKVVQASLSEAVDAFVFNISPNMTPQALNSTLATLHGMGPEVSFAMTKLMDEDDEELPPPKPLILSKTQAFPSDLAGEFSLSFSRSELDIDARYDSLLESGLELSFDVTREKFYSAASGTPDFDTYLFSMYAHRFAYRAIMDVMNKKFSVLCTEVIGLLRKVAIFSDELLTNVLVDVISELFGEYCLWDVNHPLTKHECYGTFVSFLAAVIVNSSMSVCVIRNALAQFQPSLLSQAVPMSVVLKLKDRVPVHDVYRLVADVFPDSFMLNSFQDVGDMFQTIMNNDLVGVFPFLMIYGYVRDVMKKKIEPEQVADVILHIGMDSLICSKSIIRAVIDPVFEAIYEQVLCDPLPYLEMTQAQLDQVVELLTLAIPIWKVTISKYRGIQPNVLSRLQKLLMKRTFEPKGLCFVWFGFLYDRKILQDSAYTMYLKKNERCPKPGNNSVLLEINSFLLTLIPGPLPDMNRDITLPTKGRITGYS